MGRYREVQNKSGPLPAFEGLLGLEVRHCRVSSDSNPTLQGGDLMYNLFRTLVLTEKKFRAKARRSGVY